MKVLIVAKTRQGSGACVGGITFAGQSVRLVAANAGTDERAGLDYQIGEVWEVEGEPAARLIPPHLENFLVLARQFLGPMTDPVGFAERQMLPKEGPVELLFEGLLQAALHGALFIAGRTGTPPYSTTFWRPDWPLQREEHGKRIRYRYPDDRGGKTLVFVGFQEPIELIPAGTLLRVSLAHWWRPAGDEQCELRCYAQLSGWFLPEAAGASPEVDTAVAPSASRIEVIRPAAGPEVLAAAGDLLRSVFGYDQFRPLQADIVANILGRRDTLAVMPTGSGKSLCYQLPALLFDGLTVVVSPLISLMQDQVDQLGELGVPAALLNSTLDYREYVTTTRLVREGKVKLLYTSPETLLRPETLVLLDHSHVECLAIDEAHCISSWGHDFRPEYRKLLPVRRRYAGAVCVAFTATATPRVRRDICEILGFRDRDAFVASFNRENLFLEVRPRTDGLAQTETFLEGHRNASGIIYCSTRRQVDTLTAQLARRGWPVLPYHAGLDDAMRSANQTAFSRDDRSIMVATVAFGMGINKPNVRFVLHFNLPQCIEGYYQEIGRAGRDGLRADCLLLFSRADLGTIHGFIEDGAEAERAGRHARLQAMVRFAEADGCRRSVLLDYFGETPEEGGCGFCDLCMSAEVEIVREDATLPVRQLLDCVLATRQMFGAAYLIEVLRGSRSARVMHWHHDRLEVYGAGKGCTAGRWRYLLEQCIRLRLLEQDMEHGSLRLTPKGHDARQGEKVYVVAETAAPAAPTPETLTYDFELFERLRRLRREIADSLDVPSFVVFSDRTLVEMALYYPQSQQAFRSIHGVGERKLAQHGERFLALIRSFCAERSLSERSRPAGTRDDRDPRTRERRRTDEVGDLFESGSTVAELMGLYGVRLSTIVGHLDRCVQAGRWFDPERILPVSCLSEDDRGRVLAALVEFGADGLRPVYEALGGEIGFDELHVLGLYQRCLAARSTREA